MLRRSLRRPPWRILLAAIPFFLAQPFLSQEEGLAQGRRSGRGFAASDCQLQSGGESTVLAITGPQILHLADGRFVRLAEVLVPAGVPLGFDPSAAAMTYLRETALGRKVEVKFGGNQRDRYGIYTAHIYVAGAPEIWLQQGLVSLGFAQVFPQADNHACSEQLLTAETAARKEGRGHWGLAYFKVLQARDPRSILNLVQTYQIVEGKTAQASESGGRLTLHFNEQNKFGFTAVVDPGAKKRFADKPAAENWAGLEIRVRGWVERRRGPTIPVTQPEQIEFISQESIAALKERQQGP